MSDSQPQPPVQPVQDIREVFGYLTRHKGQVFVLKLEDNLMDKPLFSLLVKDIVLIQKVGIKVVLVPGAKHSINKVLKTYKVASKSKDEVRITSDEAMPLVKLGASNVVNALISLLSENGAHGVVGNWVRARAIGVLDGVDYQNTGRVEKVNVQLVDNMLNDGLIPIVPNIGWNAVGKDYNLSSNELAVETAKALGASKLFFIGLNPGISIVPDCGFVEAGEIGTGYFSNLDLEEASLLLRDYGKYLSSEHRELTSLAVNATRYGVDRVHIINGAQDGILLKEIFSSSGHGTMFYANHYDKIHPASVQDIPEILRIMQPYVDRGVLVQRTAESLGEDIEKYYVYKVDDSLHGCGALSVYSNHSAELEALVVDQNHSGHGTGRKLVSFILDKARKMGLKSVFLLTTQSSDFFMRNGFREAPISVLPPERQNSYNRSRNSRVFSINI